MTTLPMIGEASCGFAVKRDAVDLGREQTDARISRHGELSARRNMSNLRQLVVVVPARLRAAHHADRFTSCLRNEYEAADNSRCASGCQRILECENCGTCDVAARFILPIAGNGKMNHAATCHAMRARRRCGVLSG